MSRVSAGPTMSTAHFGCEGLLRGEVREPLSSSLPEVYCISSLGCHNKILQTVWLNAQGFMFLQFWSPGCARSRSDKVWSAARAFFLFADSRLSGSLYTQPHWELGPQRMNLRDGGGGQNSVYTSHLPEDVWEKAHCLVNTTVLTYW